MHTMQIISPFIALTFSFVAIPLVQVIHTLCYMYKNDFYDCIHIRAEITRFVCLPCVHFFVVTPLPIVAIAVGIAHDQYGTSE